MKNVIEISIVILTKNGGELFRDLIRRIFSQRVNFAYEVIVVDSGSTDGTLDFLKSYPVIIFQIPSKDFCFGPTRDFGFSHAEGKYIVTLSQDVVPCDEHWLQDFTAPLIEDNVDIVQGVCKSQEGKNNFFWEKKGLFYFTSEASIFNATHGDISFSCANLGMKRNVWEKVKFGNALMSEDKMFQKKAFGEGFRIVGNRNTFVFHGHNYNVSSLIKRCENEGMGWRHIGVQYSFRQMLKDLYQKKWMFRELLKGISDGEVNKLSEMVFPLVRPIFLFKGNRFNKKYKF